MCTWTLLDLKTLGSQPIVSKNLPKHCHGGDPNLDMYYGPSTWSTFMLHWAWGIHYYKIGVLFCMVWSLDDFQGPIDFMAKHKSAMKLKAMQKTTKKLIVWSRYIYIYKNFPSFHIVLGHSQRIYHDTFGCKGFKMVKTRVWDFKLVANTPFDHTQFPRTRTLHWLSTNGSPLMLVSSRLHACFSFSISHVINHVKIDLI